jgi:chromosome transmission fidelity protein 1
MEADEREYEEKLAKARKREQQLRRMAAGRMNKKAVGCYVIWPRVGVLMLLPSAQKYTNAATRAPGEPSSSKARGVEDEEDDSAFLPEDEPTNDDGGEYISPELRALMER